MPEIIHFRGSDKIILKKHLEKDVKGTLEYIEDALRREKRGFSCWTNSAH